MITYLALLRFPQWMALSRVQRRFVWRHCVHPLLTRLPVMLAKTILLFLFIIAAYWIGVFGSLVPSIVTMIAVIFLIPELLDLWLVARHRQDIEAYIQSHGSEIQSVV
jgi:prepilin signal peptidase PulO-like enzyme (type II secretory pathway)